MGPAPGARSFGRDAAGYAAFRPGYPASLFDYLASICPDRSLAWDCGTGSGQAARGLADRFDMVIATDADGDQIARAEPHPRILYKIAAAEEPPPEAAGLDLVTVAQAVHWFDRERFYDAARRAMKPGGMLAVWTYTTLRINADVDRIVDILYGRVLGDWWPPERKLVEEGYRTLEFPFTEIRPPRFEMYADWSLDQLLGFLRTWSARRRFMEARGEDPVDGITPELESAWGPEPVRRVRWPLHLRVGRNQGPAGGSAVNASGGDRESC